MSLVSWQKLGAEKKGKKKGKSDAASLAPLPPAHAMGSDQGLWKKEGNAFVVKEKNGMMRLYPWLTWSFASRRDKNDRFEEPAAFSRERERERGVCRAIGVMENKKVNTRPSFFLDANGETDVCPDCPTLSVARDNICYCDIRSLVAKVEKTKTKTSIARVPVPTPSPTPPHVATPTFPRKKSFTTVTAFHVTFVRTRQRMPPYTHIYSPRTAPGTSGKRNITTNSNSRPTQLSLVKVSDSANETCSTCRDIDKRCTWPGSTRRF